MKVEHQEDVEETQNPKSQLPKTSEISSQRPSEQGGNGQLPTQTTREQKLRERKNKKKHGALHNAHGPKNADLADTYEQDLKKKQIIEEELALLKAKKKLPSRGIRSKRSLRSHQAHREPVKSTLPHSKTAQSKVKETEVSADAHADKHSEVENYFKQREERKEQEEKRQKEASEFIKKLKQQKRMREKSKKAPKIDNEYLQKLEDMMEQRRLKEVSWSTK